MNITRQTIIVATAAISKMDNSTREQLLYDILNMRPTAVINAMKADGINFGDVTTNAKPGQLFKVAITNLNGENRKINTIKTFREVTGHGLADAKNWCEGHTVGYSADNMLPSGVFGHHLSADMAKELHMKVVRSLSDLRFKVEILTDGHFVKPLPHDWTSGH
jgi:ribosomal protein L7/L12